MGTPSEKLAAKIAERLVAEKLVTAEDGQKLQAKLAAGKLTQEDWRLPIERADEEESSS